MTKEEKEQKRAKMREDKRFQGNFLKRKKISFKTVEKLLGAIRIQLSNQ